MGNIYKITNKINNKVYIGQTKQTVEARWKRHLQCAKSKVNRYLYNAMNHYGYDNFVLEVIEQCDDTLLDEREKYWIQYYNSFNNGYNMTLGGGGGNTWTNNPHKELTIERIKNTKIKNGTWRKPTCLGKPSPNKGKHYNLANEEEIFNAIKAGESISFICEKYNISKSTIYNWCKNKFNQSYGEIREKPVDRKEREYSEETKKRLSKIRSDNFLKEKNPNYKNINKEEILYLLKTDLKIDEIAKQLNISKPTLISKTKNFFNKTPSELRKELIK